MGVTYAELHELQNYIRQARALSRDLEDRATRCDGDTVTFMRTSVLGYANTLDELSTRAERLVDTVRMAGIVKSSGT